MQIQLALGEPDEAGARTVEIHSRPEDAAGAGAGDAWTRHATGVLAPADPTASRQAARRRSWPPAGAEEVELDGIYERLADLGLEYGPALPGPASQLAARRGDVRGSRPSRQSAASRFALHPALLDAALHAGIDLLAQEGDAPRLPATHDP